MFHLLFVLLLLPFGALHFLPTIVVALKRGCSVVGIFLLNVFLGWTVVGWMVALVWALTNEPEPVYMYPVQAYRRY